jgi:hypothetical protein
VAAARVAAAAAAATTSACEVPLAGLWAGVFCGGREEEAGDDDADEGAEAEGAGDDVEEDAGAVEAD